MRARPLIVMVLLVTLSSALFGGIASAVDRGQFADVPDNIRNWFKSVVSPSGLPCCDIADGHRTDYDIRNGQYFVPIDGLWWQVPERAVIRDSGNPVGEGVVWYVRLNGNVVINCFVPADAV